MNTHIRLAAVLLILVASSPTNAARKWTDATGSYTVEAELVGLDGENVRLRRPDGKVIAVKLSRLSSDDQEFVRRQEKSKGEPRTISPTELTGKPEELKHDDGRPAGKKSFSSRYRGRV